MQSISAVLFDLDGTLIDTAPDLLFALNKVRQEHDLTPLALSEFRSITNLGAKAMMKLAFGIEGDDKKFSYLRERFLNFYMQHVADSARLFPEMENVLDYLEERSITWGIVTNKSTKPTEALLKAMTLRHQPAVVVCGDTLSKCKPDPAPILHALDIINHKAHNTLYIGDAPTDVIASKAAGTRSLVAMYGYIHHDDNPANWKADGYVEKPIEIINWLTQYHETESA